MKRLFILFSLLLFLIPIEAQFLRTGSSYTKLPSGEVTPPSFITSDGKTLMWFMATDSIVMDGSNLVRRWGDYLNSTRDLLQATGTNQPLFVENGGDENSYVDFDGSDNYMLTNTFGSAVSQPHAIYMVIYFDSWTLNDKFLDGGTNASRLMYQTPTTPSIKNYSTGDTKTASIDTWHIIRVLCKGASGSLFYVDSSSGAGPTDTNGLAGLTLGSQRDGATPADIWVKEIIVRNNDDTGDNFDDIYDYLKAKYGL